MQTQLRRGSSGTGLQSSNSIPMASPSLPRPLPPIQGPGRSRASTRTSFSASPLKEFTTPSPTKSVTSEQVSPFLRFIIALLLHIYFATYQSKKYFYLAGAKVKF